MQTTMLSLLLGAFLSTTVLAEGESTCPSLIDNGDFETGQFDPAWSVANYEGPPPTVLEGAPCYGSYCAEVPFGAIMIQGFDVTVGKTYSVELFVRSAPDNHAPLYVWAGTTTHPTKLPVVVGSGVPTEEWTAWGTTFVVDDIPPYKITISLGGGPGSGEGTAVIVDNIRIVEVDSGLCPPFSISTSTIGGTSTSSTSASTSTSTADSNTGTTSASTTHSYTSKTSSHYPHGTGHSSYPSKSSNFTVTHHSSRPSYTTSVVCTTETHTITSCAPSVTACHVGDTTTEVRTLYTTICPVTEATTPVGATTTPEASASGSPSTKVPVKGTSASGSATAPLQSFVSGDGTQLAAKNVLGAGLLGFAIFLL